MPIVLQRNLRRHGVETRVDDVLSGRPNVTGYIDSGAEKTLLLEAHSDTVQAEAMTIPPFSPELRDGRLYGRGSCDTKGSLAAFLHGVCTALDAGGRLRCNVVILAAADEERRKARRDPEAQPTYGRYRGYAD